MPLTAYNRTRSRGVAQLVARVLWEHEVEGSSPFTPTSNNIAYLALRACVTALSVRLACLAEVTPQDIRFPIRRIGRKTGMPGRAT